VPGYPAFLAVLGIVSDAPGFIVLIQILLDIGLCALVWYLARQQFGEGQASWAAAIQATSVVSIVFACRVLSDAPFALLLIVFLAAFEYVLRVDSMRAAAMIGVLGGLLAYVRAVALLLWLIPAAALLWRRRWKQLAVFAVVFAMLLAPWVARNHVRAGYTGFSSVTAILMYRYHACLLLADQHGRPFSEQMKIIDAEVDAAGVTAAERADYSARRGREVVLSAPFRYVWLHLKADVATLFPAGGDLLRTVGVKIGGSGTLGVLHTEGLAAAARHYFQGKAWASLVLLPTILLLGAVYAFAAAGVGIRLYRREANLFDAVLIGVALYLLLVPGAASHPRFRVPAAPIIALYAGLGATMLVQTWRGRPDSA
jgi:hypothetical protein